MNQPHGNEVKRTTWVLPLVIGGLVALGGAGCHKQAAAAPAPKTALEGVVQLRASLMNAGPEVQSNLYNHVARGIRYRQYPEALAALDSIAGSPNLNDGQKKLVDEVTELVKQEAQKQQNAPAPAQ